MDDENKIRKFVRLQIYKGRDLLDILKDTCREFHDNSHNLSAYEIAQWYRNFRDDVNFCFPHSKWYNETAQHLQVFEGPPTFKYNPPKENFTEETHSNFDPIPPCEFHSLFKIIRTETGKAKRAYETRKCSETTNEFECHLNFLSERYAVDAGLDPNHLPVFHLVDILHNEKRELQTKEQFSAIKSSFGLAVLDSTHFICHFSHNDLDEEGSIIEICLFKLDAIQMRCTLMDKHRCDIYRVQFVVDSTDSRKFLFCYHEEQLNQCARRGCLTNDEKLEFEDEKLDLEIEIPEKSIFVHNGSFKFAGDKVYGLCLDQIKVKFIVFEAVFVRGKAHFLQLIDFGERLEIGHMYETAYTWSENACYMLQHDYGQITYLYKFDLDTQQRTVTNLLPDNSACCMTINNGVLVICTISSEMQHAWRRIPLSSPDTLLNLTMDHLQQEAIFMDKKEHAKLIQKLPPNLRPFGQSAMMDK